MNNMEELTKMVKLVKNPLVHKILMDFSIMKGIGNVSVRNLIAHYEKLLNYEKGITSNYKQLDLEDEINNNKNKERK
jgi:hypothetical protein